MGSIDGKFPAHGRRSAGLRPRARWPGPPRTRILARRSAPPPQPRDPPLLTTDRVTRRWLFAVLLLGFAARLAVVHARLSRPLQGDELSYDSIAWNVVQGHGYSTGASAADFRPTAVRGPGYVLLVAAFYAVFGRHAAPPLYLQALLDTLTAWCVALLAWAWFRSGRVAVLAAAL